MNIKLRNVKKDHKNDYEKSILRKNMNNQESSREQSNISNMRFWFKTFKSNQKSNNSEIS